MSSCCGLKMDREKNPELRALGQVIGLAVKMLACWDNSHLNSCFWFLASSDPKRQQGWLKWLGSCHPRGRPWLSSSSCLWPSLFLAVVGIWETNQQMKMFSLSLKFMNEKGKIIIIIKNKKTLLPSSALGSDLAVWLTTKTLTILKNCVHRGKSFLVQMFCGS